MAEREGFEPSKRFPVYTLSKRAPSTTRPPLLIKVINIFYKFIDKFFVSWKLVFFHIFLNFFVIFFNTIQCTKKINKISFRKKDYEVENLETYDFSKANITFFAAGGKIAEKYAEKAAKHTTVIDNSSFFRMDPDVPLIVPQVNGSDVKKMKKNIIIK